MRNGAGNGFPKKGIETGFGEIGIKEGIGRRDAVSGDALHSRVADFHPLPIPAGGLFEEERIAMSGSEVATKNVTHRLPRRFHEVDKGERSSFRHDVAGDLFYLLPGNYLFNPPAPTQPLGKG